MFKLPSFARARVKAMLYMLICYTEKGNEILLSITKTYSYEI